MKYKYIKEDLEKVVKESLSIAEICRKLNILPVGGNYRTLKQKINDFKIDISHFTGKGWNVGERFKKFGKEYSLKEILIKNSTYKSTYDLKLRLIKEGVKNEICEKCNNTHWFDLKIPLELHHINGDSFDNRIENLEILCPNCHALTHNYRGKNIIKKQPIIKENKIKKEKVIKENKPKEDSFTKNKKSSLVRRKQERPVYEVLKKEIEESNYCAVGKKYGVSDNAIRKWIKIYEKYGC